MVPAQQHPAEPHQAHPQQDQDPERRSQHQVGQQEAAAHGGSGGVAGGEGVAVHGEGGKHVHLVMSRPAPTHHRFDRADQDEVQQKACGRDEEEADMEEHHNAAPQTGGLPLHY